MKQPRRIIVFIGPSLPETGLPAGLDAEIRAPAAQGDIAAAVLEHRDCVIALVDGVFQRAPAVRHKEILWAMHRGAVVFGASSMGALRAAELARYGMRGRGFIYRWYRRHALAPDDAVAILHAPEALGAIALSDALIDLRIRFRRARRAGKIDRASEEAMVRAASDLHYSDRTLSAVLTRVRLAGIDVALEHVLDGSSSQKQLDASALLDEIVLRQSNDCWPTSPIKQEFVLTDAFARDMAEGGFPLDTFSND